MRLTGLYGLWNDVVYGNLMFMEWCGLWKSVGYGVLVYEVYVVWISEADGMQWFIYSWGLCNAVLYEFAGLLICLTGSTEFYGSLDDMVQILVFLCVFLVLKLTEFWGLWKYVLYGFLRFTEFSC